MNEVTGKNFVGSKEYSEKDGISFKAIDPSSNIEVDPVFYSASSAEVENAINLAKEAFLIFRDTSGKQRADFLEAIADQILAIGEPLVERAMLETALPKGRIEGERGRTIGQLKMFADLIREGSWVEASIDTPLPDRQPLPKPDIRKMYVPIGPVVVFGASNFPLAFSTAGGDTASALAAGNPVIVKAHNSHPGTSEMVARAILRAAELTGMPEGVFSHLQDIGLSVGQSLVTNFGIKAVGFTGSYRGGMALSQLAGTREEPIPVFAEMGSINPVFILPGALKERSQAIAEMYAGSITLGVGQFCTNPGLLVGLRSDLLTGFSESLDESISKISNQSMLNTGIYENYESHRELALDQSGVEILSSLEIPKHDQSNIPLTTVARVDSSEFIENPNLHNEVFGPYSLLVQCSNTKDFMTISNKLKGQLTITVMANEKDLSTYKEVIVNLREKTGRLILNGVPTGVEVCASMHHGGPFPATTDSRFTSVGTSAIKRFVRPLCFQGWPDEMLPAALRNDNPLDIWRWYNNSWTKDKIE